MTDFTGRRKELGRLCGKAVGTRRVVAVHLVVGMPGVGKTALVTRAAHRLARWYRDGQFFVDLAGHHEHQHPAHPADVLADLLIHLGIAPRYLPATLDGRSRLWRACLDGKRVLLVLDDAADIAQVEPLLPGSMDCLVLITSRRHMMGLDGAKPLLLEVLPFDEATQMFIRLTHRKPTTEDSRAIHDIVRRCDRLPLAIRILAAQVPHRPSCTLTRLAADFTADRRLAQLGSGERSVVVAFDLSHRHLAPQTQRLFRRLGLHPENEMDIHAAAALDGIPWWQARTELSTLYDASLIKETAHHRYQLHDLTQDFARELVSRDPAEEQEKAVDRLLDYYAFAAETATRRITTRSRLWPPDEARPVDIPALPNRDRALEWLRTELPNMRACVNQAILRRKHARVTRLAAALAAFLCLEGDWTWAAALHSEAMAAAKSLGDRRKQGNSALDLGCIRRLNGGFSAAAELFAQARADCQEVGDRRGEAASLIELGIVTAATADFPSAASHFEQALSLCQTGDYRPWEAQALLGLGRVTVQTDRCAEGIDPLKRALALFRELKDHSGEAQTLLELGQAHELLGEFQKAIRHQNQALTIQLEHACHQGEINTRIDLGRSLFLIGDYPAAISQQERVLSMCQGRNNRPVEACAIWELARVLEVRGEYAAAARRYQQSLDLYRENGSRLGQAGSLQGLGRVNGLLGAHRKADELLESALNVFRAIGDRSGVASALGDRAMVRGLTGDPALAVEWAVEALSLCRAIPSRPTEANLHIILGSLKVSSAEPHAALASYEEALRIARRLPSPLHEGRALEGIASAHAAPGGDRAAVIDHLRQALAIYRRLAAAEAGGAAARLAALEADG